MAACLRPSLILALLLTLLLLSTCRVKLKFTCLKHFPNFSGSLPSFPRHCKLPLPLHPQGWWSQIGKKCRLFFLHTKMLFFVPILTACTISSISLMLRMLHSDILSSSTVRAGCTDSMQQWNAHNVMKTDPSKLHTFQWTPKATAYRSGWMVTW